MHGAVKVKVTSRPGLDYLGAEALSAKNVAR